MFKNKKSITSSLLVLTLVLMLSSCGTKTTNTATSVESTEPTESTPSSTFDTEETNFHVYFTIKNGTEVIGTSTADGDVSKNEDIVALVTNDYPDAYDIILYENFSEETPDLVVIYSGIAKLVLCAYNDRQLEYIPLPDEKMLETIYAYEGFDTYPSDLFPKDLLATIKNNFEKDDYASVYNEFLPAMDNEQLLEWTDYYTNLAKDTNTPTTFNLETTKGYKVDYNNDGIEDILLISIEGSGNYAYENRLQGVGDGSYVINNYATLMEGYQFIVPVKFGDVNYILQSSDTNYYSQISTSLCYVKSNGDGTNSLSVATFTNYLPGYKLVNAEFAEGYENFEEYMFSRLGTANIALLRVMGTAEKDVEVVPSNSFEEIYTVTADYNNDGVEDTVTKKLSYMYGGIYSSIIVAESNDEVLTQTINSLNSGASDSVLTMFLDETEYGNILFVATGQFDRIGTVKAYKITRDQVELIGTINLENINFNKVEEKEVE